MTRGEHSSHLDTTNLAVLYMGVSDGLKHVVSLLRGEEGIKRSHTIDLFRSFNY